MTMVDEKPHERPSERFVLKNVLRYLRPFLALLGLGIVIALLNRGLALVVPQIVSRIVDSATGEAANASIQNMALILLAVFLASAAMQFGNTLLFAYVGERVALALRKDLFAHLLSLSADFFQRRRTGELLSRVANDATIIQTIGTTFPVDALRQSVTFAGGIILIGITNVRLTLILLAFLPLVGVATAVLGRRIRKLSTEVQDKMANSTIVFEEAVSGVETVKSFGRERHETDRYDSHLLEVLKTAMRRVLAQAAMGSSVRLLFFSGMAAVLWYAAGMIRSERMTTGELIAFLLYTLLVGNSFSGLASLWARWQRLLGAGQRVFQLLLESPSVKDRPDAVGFDGRHESIRFDDVHFTYPSRPDREVLHGLDFEVKRGEVVALVGPSGAGKSTVVALLLRHFDVTSGAITIDGRDLRELKLADLREAIALVPQDIVIFGRTLRENIAYGDLEASAEQIDAAARAAHALEFIERAPRGLDTPAGDRGVLLSGGEKQRIAIARAMLKSPPILILDEATSSLDTESEQLVKDALSHLMTDRTTFVIAHRLSTIERADRVLVMHQGEVVESGTHAELLAHGGHYARLHRAGTWEP